jgi:hypothetical protein
VSKVRPPSDAEFEDMITRYERGPALVGRVATIEEWIVKPKVEATPTELKAAVKYCTAVRDYCSAGKFELAHSSLRGLESCVGAIKSRLAAPLIAIGKKQRDAWLRGGRPKNPNDRQMAIEFRRARANGSRLKDTPLKVKIGKKYGLSRSGSVKAINRALKNYPPTL